MNKLPEPRVHRSSPYDTPKSVRKINQTSLPNSAAGSPKISSGIANAAAGKNPFEEEGYDETKNPFAEDEANEPTNPFDEDEDYDKNLNPFA